MKVILCDMCQSMDLIQKGSGYLCPHCGTKYSIEKAEKMIIECNEDISDSTVKAENHIAKQLGKPKCFKTFLHRMIKKQ